MKGRTECAETLAKHSRSFELFPAALLLMKVVVGVGGIIMVTNTALFWVEPPAKSMHVEHGGRERLATTPGRSNSRHQLRGVPSRSTGESSDTAEVHPGVAAASDIDNQTADLADTDAATPRRLRMMPMEGHWGEWFISPNARSDENEDNPEKPEEGRKNKGFEDWFLADDDADDNIPGYYANYAHLNDVDADDDVSDYYANHAHLNDGENTFSGHGGEEGELKGLKARFTNYDKLGDAAGTGYHSGHDGYIVPGQGRGHAEEEGGIDTKSERADLENDGHLGTSKGNSDATEMSVDAGKYKFKTARRSDTKLDAGEHHGQQQATKEEEQMDWSTDDGGVFHQAHTGRVTAFNSRPRPGGFPPSLDQLDKRDGLWAAGRGAEKFDFDGGKHHEQGILTTNLYPKSAPVRRQDIPPTDEAEVLLSRRRFRRQDANWENDISSVAWLQTEDDVKKVSGMWDTDDDFLIHVVHYSRSAKGNQRRTPAAAEPVRRRRQWERERASLWDTDDDVLHYDESYRQLGTARSAVNDPAAAAGMPAAPPIHKETQTEESWATDDVSFYDVSGASSTVKEKGREDTTLSEMETEHLGRWEKNDDFQHYEYHMSRTSGDRDGEQGPGFTDDWGLDGGTYISEVNQMLAAIKDGHGGQATATGEKEEDEEKEDEEDEEDEEDDLAFDSIGYNQQFAYDEVGVGEEKEDKGEKAPIEPYSEYYSYLAEMKQLLQQGPSSKTHGMKTAPSAADDEQQKRPLEKQEKEWGRLGLLMTPLLEVFSAGKKGGALGFLEALLPHKLLDSRDDAILSGEEKTAKNPEQNMVTTKEEGRKA